MRWSFRHFLAALFLAETVFFLVRDVVYLAEGWPISVPWLIGLVLTPAVFLSAAWFVWRGEPSTLLSTAIARTLVLFVAVIWNILVVYSISMGYFRFI